MYHVCAMCIVHGSKEIAGDMLFNEYVCGLVRKYTGNTIKIKIIPFISYQGRTLFGLDREQSSQTNTMNYPKKTGFNLY